VLLKSALETAIQTADINALRLSLFQLTGDTMFRDLDPASIPPADMLRRPGQAPPSSPETDAIRARAIEILAEGVPAKPAPPSDDELRVMLDSIGKTLTDDEFQLHRDILAFDGKGRFAEWTEDVPSEALRTRVVVIGAGVSGVAAGVQLAKLGLDYTIYERRSEVGGTWSLNTYPDARVDTSSFTYQFSYEPDHRWTEFFARQPEVRQYLETVARKHGVMDHIKFGHELTSATYNETNGAWSLRIGTPEGEIIEDSAAFVISASGLFSTPKSLPDSIVGQFRGRIVHSTQFTAEDVQPGDRVAIVGNGSTGVQMLARVAEVAAHVAVIQRTPQWIAPRDRYGDPVDDGTTALLDSLPYYYNWLCYLTARPTLLAASIQEVDRAWQASGGLISKANDKMREDLTAYIRSQVGDRDDLFDRLVPRHPPMSRRLIVDNGWYRALLRDNVTLVTGELTDSFTEGIVTDDGTRHPVDLLVLATGFDVEKYVWPADYQGEGGVTLQSEWEELGARAYLGMTVPRFPNLFLMYGPNAQNRFGGVFVMIESWAAYIGQCIVKVIEGGHTSIAVSDEAYEKYNAALDEAGRDLVWYDPSAVERNYYVNHLGRQSVGVPWQEAHYHQMLSRPDYADYIIR
jgi:4-hydroxyacetophenone monooxygenase